MKIKETTIIILGAFVFILGLVWLTTLGEKKQNSSSQSVNSNQDQAAGVFNSLIGKPAPDFTLESFDNQKITLSELKGKNVVLFFNEGLMCYPACWNQTAAFGKGNELEEKGAVVLNIVVDSKTAWQEATTKMPELAKATVLFDPGAKVSASYGTLSLPSSMHKGQYPGHSYVLIDKDGVVRYVLDDPQMAIRNKELAQELDKI